MRRRFDLLLLVPRAGMRTDYLQVPGSQISISCKKNLPPAKTAQKEKSCLPLKVFNRRDNAFARILLTRLVSHLGSKIGRYWVLSPGENSGQKEKSLHLQTGRDLKPTRKSCFSEMPKIELDQELLRFPPNFRLYSFFFF